MYWVPVVFLLLLLFNFRLDSISTTSNPWQLLSFPILSLEVWRSKLFLNLILHYATSGKDLGFNVCKKIYKTLPLFYSLCLVWNWNWSWWWKYFPAFNHFTPAPMWVTVENFHQKDADSFKRLPTIEFFGALIIWGTYFSVQNYKKWVYFGYRPTLLWKTTNNGFILDIDELFCGKPQQKMG